jgi:hypothetical protein
MKSNNRLTNFINSKWLHLVTFVSLFIILLSFCLYNFQPFFYGDELVSRAASNTGDFLEGYIKVMTYKPRVLSNLFITIGYRLFYYHRIMLTIISAFLQAAALYYLWTILVETIGLNRIIASISIIFISINRFNIVCTGEVEMGLIEGIGTVFFVITLKAIITAYYSNDFKHLLWATVWAYLTYLCHERYGVLLGTLFILCIWQWIQHRNYKLIILPFGIIILLLSIPILGIIFGSHGTFNATGGKAFTFNIYQIADFYSQTIMQLLNINWGYHACLIGTPFDITNFWHIALAASFISIIIYSLILFFKKNSSSNESILLFYFLLIFILAPLLLMASLSLRIELRWLWQPYMVLIIIMAIILPKSKKGTLLLLSSFIFFVSNIVYLQNMNELYFVGYSNYVKSLGGNIVDLKKDASVCLIVSNDRFNDPSVQYHLSELFPTNISPEMKITISKEFQANIKLYDKVLFESTNGKITPLILGHDLHSAYLLSGWHGWENDSNNIWMAKKAEAYFHTENFGKMTLTGFLPKTHLPNKITIFIDNKEIKKYDLTQENVNLEISDIPLNTIIRLKIIVDKALVPKEMGIGEDLRELGLLVHNIKFL